MRFIFTLAILIPLYLNSQPVKFDYQGNKSTCKCISNDNSIDSLQAVISSDTISDKRYLGCCYHCLGVIGYSQKEFGLFHKAIPSINLAIQLSDREKNRPNNYRYLGNCYTAIGEFEKAESALNTALQLANLDEYKAQINNTICILHIENG